MEQKKIITLGAVLVALIAIIGLAAASMAATDNQNVDNQSQLPASCVHNWQGKNKPELTDEQKQEMEVKRRAIETALANNDYQAWVQAVGADSEQISKITADNFPQMVEAYQLEKQAKGLMDQARQIREQLGLKGQQMGNGPFNGQFRGFRNFLEPLKTE